MTKDTNSISANEIRARFASSLSMMYRKEVPQYSTLLELVSKINKEFYQHDDACRDSPQRVEVERHGAIRLGTAEELATMRRLFSIMGMEPVGYYDLTIAGLPVHATGFRPLSQSSLDYNPFRIFTSLLRLDLIEDETTREQAAKILSQRAIFTPRCLEMIEAFEKDPNRSEDMVHEVIQEALETFRWHATSTVDMAQYKALEASHPLVADVVCFKGPHINHLTPRVLDIDAAQGAMTSRGLQAKETIEGPPPRQNAILLRQTSFLALEENISFSDGAQRNGKHRARFGEIEQRGMALTPKGRLLYDELLNRYHHACSQLTATSTVSKSSILESCFKDFPDDLDTLRREQLAFFRYSVTENIQRPSEITDVTSMVEDGILECTPITYEDFLPASAAGIFYSNLRPGYEDHQSASSDREAFEMALGCAVNDEFDCYSNIEQSSLQKCFDYLTQSD